MLLHRLLPFSVVLSAGAQVAPSCNSTASQGCVVGAAASCAASFSWSSRTDWASGPISENVVYKSDVPTQQAMTIYQTAAQSGADPVPILVFVHGGGWSGKDHTPEHMNDNFLPLVAKGFLVVSLGYRLSGTAKYPAAIDDVEAGILWLKNNAATYNADPTKMIVGGTSAGGHLASLLGTRNGPTSPVRVSGIVNFYGAAWLNVNGGDGITGLLGCTTPGTPGTACYDLAISASPTTYVDGTDPPFLHLHGDMDTTAPYTFSTTFHDLLAGSGHPDSTVILSPGAGHASNVVLNRYPNGRQIFEDWIVNHAKCANNTFFASGGGGGETVPSPARPPPAPPLSVGAESNPCFPSAAMVVRANGTSSRVDALKEGDQIVAATADGALTTDTVSLLSIAKPEAHAPFAVLTTSTNHTLTLTAEHHLPIGAACCSILKKAKDVVVGEMVWVVSANAAVAATVSSTGATKGAGLHSPVLTNGGFPVVDGVITSFDSMEKVTLAKHGLAPLLTACKATGTCANFRELFLGNDKEYIS